MYPQHRLRRQRSHPQIRALLEETQLKTQDFIFPLFITEGRNPEPIDSMPGIERHTLRTVLEECDKCLSLGIRSILLFGIPEEAKKSATGSIALHKDNIIQRALREIKKRFHKDILLITDLCFCGYTDHGHCGILTNNALDNDASLEMLSKQALSHAEHGADIIAPSGMLDGMVQAIRSILDSHKFTHIPIMSYAVKYASAYYGPFRSGVKSSLKASEDRRSYQMNPPNRREAQLEAKQDIHEGADIIMVKPALPYLDILRELRNSTEYPLAAYQVSGEYTLIKTAARLGYIDEKPLVLESLISIKRAGADIIISYFSKDIALWLQNTN